MKKILATALVLMLSLSLCFSATVISFAEEIFDITEVYEDELAETAGEEVELYAVDAADAVCYIGKDEASRVYYATLEDAVAAGNAKWIYLMKDVTWEGATHTGKDISIKSADSTRHKITMTKSLRITGSGNLAFENIIIDLDYKGTLLVNGSVATLTNTDVLNGTGDWGTIMIGDWGAWGIVTVNGNSTITGKATYTGAGGVVTIHDSAGGKFVMNGGTIVNMAAGSKPAVKAIAANGTVEISGNTTITNGTSTDASPTTGTNKSIMVKSATALTVKSNFTGSFDVAYGAAGEAFGVVEAGADISKITLHGTTIAATNKDGVLTWETADEAAARNTVCYIDENVEGKRYASLHEAIAAATSGSTIYVTKDITWDNVTTYYNKNITIKSADSAKKKITMPSTASLKITGENGKVTFENVTLDFNFNGKNLQIDDGATVYLVGADVLNGKGGVGGTVILGGGTYGHLVMDENSTISGRSSQTSENIGGVVHLHNENGHSTFTMNGGTIINYNTNLYAVSPWKNNCTITIGGNAKIINGVSSEATPVTGTKDAINLRWDTVLKVKGDFTGDIKINYGSLGDKIGTAEAGAKISGNLTNFSKGTPAVVKNGDIIWDYACYVGTDTAANRYYTVGEALKGTKTSKVYMVKDAIWEPSLDANTGTYANAKLTVNGNGYTLTPSKSMRMAYNTDIIFEDVTVDMNGKTFTITDGAKVTLNDGAHFINGGSGYGQGGTFATWSNHDITITMNPGSSITGSKAEYGGAMVLNKGSKFIMNGGEISGNQATVGRFGGAIKANAGAIVTISGNAKIEGNKSGPNWSTAGTDNIALENAEILTVNSDFTGHIGIWYEANKDQGKVVGKAGEGFTSVPSVNSITNDADSGLFGWINADGNIEWQAKPVITVTLDYGTYANGAKGIVRFINEFTSAPAAANITGFGTYVLDNQSFSEADLAATENKFVKSETSVLALGKGFITDIHTGNLDKAYTASSFCYIEGVEAPVFTTVSASSINSVDGVKELSDNVIAEYESSYEN